MYKRTILYLAPLALLSGCAGLAGLMTGVPTSPAAVADRTKLDEQAALGVELAYQAANRAVYFAAKGGFLSDAQKAAAAEADNTAYRAVVAVRAAYDAGNASSYAVAAARAQAAVASFVAVTK